MSEGVWNTCIYIGVEADIWKFLGISFYITSESSSLFTSLLCFSRSQSVWSLDSGLDTLKKQGLEVPLLLEESLQVSIHPLHSSPTPFHSLDTILKELIGLGQHFYNAVGSSDLGLIIILNDLCSLQIGKDLHFHDIWH